MENITNFINGFKNFIENLKVIAINVIDFLPNEIQIILISGLIITISLFIYRLFK